MTQSASALSPAPLRADSFTVSSLNDSGVGSLRQAMLDADGSAGADTIDFSVSGTIVLASALPDIEVDELTIDGSGQSVTISGDNAVRPFSVDTGASLTLENLTVTDGRAGTAGAIFNNAGGH